MKEKLEKEKVQLEQKREQAIATINQITGAISMLDKVINELLDEEVIKEVKEIKKDK